MIAAPRWAPAATTVSACARRLFLATRPLPMLWFRCAGRMFLWPCCCAPGFSACTSVVFLTSPVTGCATYTRAGREGVRTGGAGEISGGTLEALGKGAHVVSAPSRRARMLLP